MYIYALGETIILSQKLENSHGDNILGKGMNIPNLLLLWGK